MMRSVHINCQLHIKVLYVLVTLLFLILLVNSFLFIYIPQFFERRLVSSDNEISYFESENGIINTPANSNNKNVLKRETSFADGKDCGDNCKKDDIIVLKGNWNVKKSDLWEYCFSAENFCQRFNSTSKENVSESDEENVKNGTSETKLNVPIKDCILTGIGKAKVAPVPRSSPDLLSIDPYGNHEEVRVWKTNYDRRKIWLTEYKYDRDFTNYTQVQNIGLLVENFHMGMLSGTVYKGNFYCETESARHVVKFNLTSMTKIMEKKLEGIPPIRYFYSLAFQSDENGLWVLYIPERTKHSEKQSNGQALGYYTTFTAIQIDPDTLEVLSVNREIRSAKIPYHWEVETFVAFGRLYRLPFFPEFYREKFADKRDEIYSVLDLLGRDDREIVIDFDPPANMRNVVYNWKTQYLYVFASEKVYRYKLDFTCLN